MFTKRLNRSSILSGTLAIILTVILLAGYQELSIASIYKTPQVTASLSQSTTAKLSSSSFITSTTTPFPTSTPSSVTPSPTPAPSSTITSTITSTIPYDEAIDGDLSDDPLSPNQFTLSMGMNPITATLTQGDTEYFSLIVPDGMVMSAIMLNSYEVIPDGPEWTYSIYMSIQEGLTFETQVTTAADAALVGNIRFGERNGQIGTNILTSLFVPFEGSCPEWPIASGAYAVQLGQETSETATYSLNFVVTTATAHDTHLPIIATGDPMQESALCSNIEWMREDIGWMYGEEVEFSFLLPIDMVDHGEQGIDSLVGRYTRGGMKLYFDYGMYTRPPVILCKRPDYSATPLELSGKPAKIFSTKNYANLYVPNADEHNGEFVGHLDMSISFDEANDKAIARCILESVRFPE